MKGDTVVDWNEVWRKRLVLNQATTGFKEGADLWSDREQARRYVTRSKTDHAHRVAETLKDLRLSPGDRVLDIGSGPGTLALPLAQAGATVTAIDPAEGMLAELREEALRENLTNITMIQAPWEEIDVDTDLTPPYDRIIASFSLTILDIRSALAKMNTVVSESGSVHLYWFADEPLWEQIYLALWKDLHGEIYHPRPKADCLFNVLYGMQIYPNVLMRPMDRDTFFATVEDAADHFAPRMGVKTPRQQKILRDYFSELLTPHGDGFVLAGRSTYASIWWQKAEIDII